MTLRSLSIALAVAIGATGLGAAQQPLPVAGAGQPTYKPVEVSADRRVTLRIAAPEAATVTATIAGKSYPMTRDAKGVWAATSDPLVPELWLYSFRIGGATVNEGEVLVKAPSPAIYEPRDVPHGTVTLVTYRSDVQHRARPMRIYLPPQYYTEPYRRFPVLYLFNGQDEYQWTTTGRANVMLDNLIAEGRAVPMIVVMPNNTIVEEGLSSSAATVAVIERELPAEIMPLVEKTYRAMGDRDHRAIAGLSFGGGTAFGVGMRHLDWFADVGEFGTGTFGGLANPTTGYVSYLTPYDPEKIAPGIWRNLTATATRPSLFYMACGEDDPRLPFQKAAYEDFRRHGVSPVFRTFPGGHDFRFFRAALADFASRAFKPVSGG